MQNIVVLNKHQYFSFSIIHAPVHDIYIIIIKSNKILRLVMLLVSFTALYTDISSNITENCELFANEQELASDQAFAIHSHPNKSYMEQLAKETLFKDVTGKQIHRWLCEKRKKEKGKKPCELTQLT